MSFGLAELEVWYRSPLPPEPGFARREAHNDKSLRLYMHRPAS
jgi:hypothetical protein